MNGFEQQMKTMWHQNYWKGGLLKTKTL